MGDEVQPGERGEPLPVSELVIRIIKSMDEEPAEGDFELSSQERASNFRAISVWASSLTSPEDARNLMGEKAMRYRTYTKMLVRYIHDLTTPDLQVPPLTVVWDPIEGERTKLTGGHAGILGLERPPIFEKKVYKTLRVSLADLAKKSIHRF